MLENSPFSNNVGFAVGTGRCGTKFLSEIVRLERKVAAVHERNPFNEAFHRYCRWYNLPVDDIGFLSTKANEIKQDLNENNFSFEASAHLSLSIYPLYEAFGAKFVLLVRSPEKVVNSYVRKGWYKQKAVRGNSNLALGYQSYCEKPHHFLGRIMPSGEEFDDWNRLSQVGKISWYWNALNSKVIEQFSNLPKENFLVEKLENLSYERYLQIANFLGYKPSLTAGMFRSVSQLRPNRSKRNLKTADSWTETETAEFETQVEPMAEELGYEHRVNRLVCR